MRASPDENVMLFPHFLVHAHARKILSNEESVLLTGTNSCYQTKQTRYMVPSFIKEETSEPKTGVLSNSQS